MEGFSRVLAVGESDSLDAVYLARDGSSLNVEGNLSCSFRGNDPVAVWAICRDVTSRKRADQQLYRMAHHDVLTDLPNRQLFMDRLKQLRGMAVRMGRHIAVLYLDLDRFKNVNDSLGHAVGDKLLQVVASRLLATVRETDTVARIGGDEFVVALGNLRKPEGAQALAAKVLQALSEPYQIDCHELFMTSSVGISVYPEDGGTLEELIEKADMALYAAKEAGRNCYKNFADLKKCPVGEVPEALTKSKAGDAYAFAAEVR
jgi:diguanylate cyclase (GGDEF)-like protein